MNGTLYEAPTDFTVAFTSVITITWLADTTLAGRDAGARSSSTLLGRMTSALQSMRSRWSGTVAPDIPCQSRFSDRQRSNGIYASAAIAAVTPAWWPGLPERDIPRACSPLPATSWRRGPTPHVITITGKDVYGNAVVESSVFRYVLYRKEGVQVAQPDQVSADVTGATVGFGDVLGLPVFLPGTAAGYILQELEGWRHE